MTSLLTDTERLTTLIAGLSVLALGVYSAREGTRVGGRAFDRSVPQPAQTPCAAERCNSLQKSVFRMVEYPAPLPDKCEGSTARLVGKSIHVCHHVNTRCCLWHKKEGRPVRVRLDMVKLATETSGGFCSCAARRACRRPRESAVNTLTSRC